MRYLFFLIVVIIVFIEDCSNSNENKEKEEFIATHEWKTVKKGQKLPRGLHYRINLKTGSSEAKLIDDEPDLSNNKKDLIQLNTKSEKIYTPEEIKETLKNIIGDDGGKYDEKIKTKFRSLNQLKEELGVLNLTSKVDAQIIKDLLKEHKDEFAEDRVNIDNVLNILEDFSYLSHQFDNGLEFVNQNGFRDVIYKNLNFTSNKIRESTLRLFGSLVQNNARVQIHALETGGINVLLRILSSESSTELLQNNAVFALGSLLRRFPLAQQQFVENGGVFVVLQLFKKSTLKIQVKILTLMSDLFLEKKQADKNQIVMSQYKLVNLEQQLIEQNWCTYIDKVLTDVVNKNPEDHDSIEKVLTALQTVSNSCRVFNKQVLFNLKIKYENLANKLDDKTDNFFRDLFTLCSDILNHKTIKTEL